MISLNQLKKTNKGKKDKDNTTATVIQYQRKITPVNGNYYTFTNTYLITSTKKTK